MSVALISGGESALLSIPCCGPNGVTEYGMPLEDGTPTLRVHRTGAATTAVFVKINAHVEYSPDPDVDPVITWELVGRFDFQASPKPYFSTDLRTLTDDASFQTNFGGGEEVVEDLVFHPEGAFGPDITSADYSMWFSTCYIHARRNAPFSETFTELVEDVLTAPNRPVMP